MVAANEIARPLAGKRYKNPALVWAAMLSFGAALLHLATIAGGEDWYRAMGAGEQMARMARAGDPYPTYLTLFIAAVLSLWGLFALAGAGVIRKLPFTRLALYLIAAVYTLRGLYGLVLAGLLGAGMLDAPYLISLGIRFWLVSSLICLGIGLVHIAGLRFGAEVKVRAMKVQS